MAEAGSNLALCIAVERGCKWKNTAFTNTVRATVFDMSWASQ